MIRSLLRTSHIVRSLKNPDEVSALCRISGPGTMSRIDFERRRRHWVTAKQVAARAQLTNARGLAMEESCSRAYGSGYAESLAAFAASITSESVRSPWLFLLVSDLPIL
jgi:hypothetical protein